MYKRLPTKANSGEYSGFDYVAQSFVSEVTGGIHGWPVTRFTLLGAETNHWGTFRLMGPSVPWWWCLTRDEPVCAYLTCEWEQRLTMQAGLTARLVWNVVSAPISQCCFFQWCRKALQCPPQWDNENSYLVQQTRCRTVLNSYQLHSIKHKIMQQYLGYEFAGNVPICCHRTRFLLTKH